LFTISASIANPTFNGSAMCAIAGDSPCSPIVKIKPNDSYVAITPVPDVIANTITVPSLDEARSELVIINGITYTRTLNLPPNIGEFTEFNGQIIIGYAGVTPALIVIATAIRTIDTDIVTAPYPEIFTRWPIVGEVSWTMGFEEQPSASLSFTCDAKYRDEIIDYFVEDEAIEIYGTGYSKSGTLNIKDIATTKSAIPIIQCSMNLTGAHAGKLDKSVNVVSIADTQCNEYWTKILATTVADVALLAKLTVSGGSILIPASLSSSLLSGTSVYTTVASLLENNAVRTLGAYVDYNRVDRIELVDWDKSGTAPECDLGDDDIDTTIRHLAGSIYSKLYDPAVKITFGSNIPKTFTLASRDRAVDRTETIEGDANPQISAYPSINRDLSIVFDISGKRKRRKVTKLYKGQPEREVEEEWGYVAVAIDDVVFTGGLNPIIDSINGAWQRISIQIKDYYYDKYGYLVKVVGTGLIKSRYKVENAQKPETRSINVGNPPDAKAVALIDTYRFFSLPSLSVEEYQLEPLANYYSDIKTQTITQKICLPDGKIIYVNRVDPDWVPPYFVAKSRVVERSFAAIANPQSTALKPLPQLTTGKNSEFVEQVRIIDNNYYSKSTDNFGSSGAQLGTVLSIGESQLIKGRPPVATYRKAAADEADSSNSITTSSFTNDYFGIYSLGEESYIPPSTIDYPNAATKKIALAAAQTDIDITNTKNCRVSTLRLSKFITGIYPGQKFNYRVGSQVRSARILSISQSLKIHGVVGDTPIVTHSGTQLKIGEAISTPVTSYDLTKYVVVATDR
jgi:hypothetical protein